MNDRPASHAIWQATHLRRYRFNGRLRNFTSYTSTSSKLYRKNILIYNCRCCIDLSLRCYRDADTPPVDNFCFRFGSVSSVSTSSNHSNSPSFQYCLILITCIFFRKCIAIDPLQYTLRELETPPPPTLAPLCSRCDAFENSTFATSR